MQGLELSQFGDRLVQPSTAIAQVRVVAVPFGLHDPVPCLEGARRHQKGEPFHLRLEWVERVERVEWVEPELSLVELVEPEVSSDVAEPSKVCKLPAPWESSKNFVIASYYTKSCWWYIFFKKRNCLVNLSGLLLLCVVMCFLCIFYVAAWGSHWKGMGAPITLCPKLCAKVLASKCLQWDQDPAWMLV